MDFLGLRRVRKAEIHGVARGGTEADGRRRVQLNYGGAILLGVAIRRTQQGDDEPCARRGAYILYLRPARSAGARAGRLSAQPRAVAFSMPTTATRGFAVAGVTVGISSIPWTREGWNGNMHSRKSRRCSTPRSTRICTCATVSRMRPTATTISQMLGTTTHTTSGLPTGLCRRTRNTPLSARASRLGKPTGCAVMGGMGFPRSSRCGSTTAADASAPGAAGSTRRSSSKARSPTAISSGAQRAAAPCCRCRKASFRRIPTR